MLQHAARRVLDRLAEAACRNMNVAVVALGIPSAVDHNYTSWWILHKLMLEGLVAKEGKLYRLV